MEFQQAIKMMKPSQLLRFGFAVDPNYHPRDIWNTTTMLTPNIDHSYVDFIIFDQNKLSQIVHDLFPQYPADLRLLSCDFNTMVHKVKSGEYKIDGAICGAVQHNGKTMFINEEQRAFINDQTDQQTPLFKMVKEFLQTTK